MIFFLYLWMITTCMLDLYIDYYDIEKKNREIRHSASLILPVAEMFIGFFLMGWLSQMLGWVFFFDCMAVAAAYPGCRWFIHSNGLNLLRRLDRDYTGVGVGTAPDAKSDQWLDKYKRRTGLSPTALRILVMSVSLKLSCLLVLTNHYIHSL